MKTRYIVVRTTTREHVSSHATQALADKGVKFEEKRDARLVEAGWIATPATYVVVKL